MSFVTIKDPRGHEQRYEAPGKDEKGRPPLAFLLPSGATRVHPMYAYAKEEGIPDENIREAHKGVDGKGNEYVRDQKWIHDAAELAQAEQDTPERVVRVEG